MNLKLFAMRYREEAGDEGAGDGDGGEGTHTSGEGLLGSARASGQGGDEGDEGDGDGGGEGGGDEGGRPDYIGEKFWDADKGEVRTKELAEAYKGLETKLGRGDHKAPDDPANYKLELPEDLKTYQKPEGDDPVETWFRGTAKEIGLSQEQAAALYQGYVSQLDGMLPAPMDVEAEKAQLGDNPDGVINMMSSRLDQFTKIGLFNEQDIEEFEVAVGTANGMKMMMKLMEFYGDKSVPVDLPTGDGIPSSEELRQMRWKKNDDGQVMYEIDTDYRAKVDGLYEQLYGTEPAGTSRKAG